MTLAERSSNGPSELLEKVVIQGDLEKLSPIERVDYYRRVCNSIGLNPLTRPFEYIKLQGRLTLYAKKDATEQLAAQHSISISLNEGQILDDVYVVRARAAQETRHADATGVVPIDGLKGETKANALMKAETKASRRAVLRLVGLGWLDESEIESIPDAAVVAVDHDTGAIVDQPIPAKQLPKSKQSSQTSAPTDKDLEAGSWPSLRVYVEGMGWEWKDFEQQVMGMEQSDFEKLGGTPVTAWKRYLKISAVDPSR